jgi:hypothetical protein
MCALWRQEKTVAPWGYERGFAGGLWRTKDFGESAALFVGAGFLRRKAFVQAYTK